MKVYLISGRHYDKPFTNFVDVYSKPEFALKELLKMLERDSQYRIVEATVDLEDGFINHTVIDIDKDGNFKIDSIDTLLMKRYFEEVRSEAT